MDDLTTTAVEGFGLMYYGARFYDPALGRFTSADTVIPGAGTSQAWDRFAYAMNNPLRYIDPSGHEPVCVEYDDDGGCSRYEESNANTNEDIANNLYTLANFTQDVATTIDGGFAVLEVGVGLVGLAGGPETIPVVVTGMDIAYNFSGANLAETIFSGLSLACTTLADAYDDGQLGDATLTSAATFAAGAFMADPIGDLVIDGYASGYNHGIFSGIDALMNGASFFK